MLMQSLSHFVVLASEKNVDRAAQKCEIKPPTFLISIRKLEEYLGAPLINMKANTVDLTAEGEAVHLRAKKILADYEMMRIDVRSPCSQGGPSERYRQSSKI